MQDQLGMGWDGRYDEEGAQDVNNNYEHGTHDEFECPGDEICSWNRDHSIHCTTCHSETALDDGPVWDYSEDYGLTGFGLCAYCNSEAYGSGAWALSVGAVDAEELDESCDRRDDCKNAEEIVWS